MTAYLHGARPISYWRKGEVIDYCIGQGVSPECIAVLRRMTLPDIRSTCLVYVGTDITGNEYDEAKQRHTKFWRVDLDYVNGLADVGGECRWPRTG